MPSRNVYFFLSSSIRWCSFIVISFILVGCAEQRIRDQSNFSLVNGDYERALSELESGLKQFPDSVLLRTGMIQARSEALSGIIAKAGSLRATGKLEESQKELQRAQAMDPRNERLNSLLIEVDIERRQLDAKNRAEILLAKKNTSGASKVIEEALKDQPRNPALLSLYRQIENTQRQEQISAAQAAISESRPISLDFRDANLRTVLDVISRNSGINFVIDKDVRSDAKVTVYLRDARLEDALELIVSTNQLSKKVLDARTIVVYPNTLEKQREYQEQLIRIFYLTSGEAKTAATFLKSMLKIRDPYVDERTNMLALRESPENIQLAERLVSAFDSGEPEVLLEVEVLEVSSTRLTSLGVQFPDTFTLTPIVPTGASQLTLGSVQAINRDSIGLSIAGLTINIKRQLGDFHTLANPKIRVRNKEKAKIMVGDKIPVVTTTTSQTGFVSDSVNYLDVGMKLEVEPTVYYNEEVAIKLSLEVSTLGLAIKTASGSTAYQIGTRNANTVLRLQDGETQFLAGLISRSDQNSSSRVPGLGDIPLFGRLFSAQTDSGSRNEIVLAITPHILRNIRHKEAFEAEMWVGTESAPKLRPVGGLRTGIDVPNKPPANSPVQTSGEAAPNSNSIPIKGNDNAVQATAGNISQVRFQLSGSKSVKKGDVLDIDLDISSTQALRGAQAEFIYTRDKLELVEIQEGSFFMQGGAQTSFSKSAETKEGKITVGVVRNQVTGTTGSASFLSFRFKAIQPGAAEVKLQSANPLIFGASLDLQANPNMPPPVVITIE